MKRVYICQECGYESSKWMGKCPVCGAWGSMVEEVRERKKKEKKPGNPLKLSEIDLAKEERVASGFDEVDRVLGGGFVRGSLVLLGGDPGIGKSTLTLQICGNISRDKPVLYVSGEESLRQVKLRAERLGVSSESLYLLSETDMDVIEGTVEKLNPEFLVVDSIQTVYSPELESPPGSVSQVKECTSRIMRTAKERNITSILIGHITKGGVIAGPKTLEHMVDVVLYLEGDRHHEFRILRGIKNRFGSTNEIGIFEMKREGLREVENPSLALLEGREKYVPGSVVVPAVEGTRPFLVEVQALVSPARFTAPQRVSTGCDYRRISMLIAVLERRLNLNIGAYDIFTNIAGGIRIEEPGTDLGIVLAMLSSYLDIPFDPLTSVVGEVGLSGEVRAVSFIEKRIKESERLGMRRILVPDQRIEGEWKIEVKRIKNVKEAYGILQEKGKDS